MTEFPYIVRNYQPLDFDDYVRLRQEAEKLEPTGRHISPQAIAESLARPNYSAGQDLSVVEIDGRLIGYMDITLELGIGRVILDCWLHPEHRRKGLATKLTGYAMGRAREAGARVAHVNIMEDNRVAKIVLSKLGFQYVRQFLELKLDMAKLDKQALNQAVQECCHLRHGEEEKLTRIQNRCFTDTWGYNPNTVATITYRTHLSHFSPADVILTYDGDKVTGYCWTEIYYDREATAGQREGRICMLGVDPDYRGRGIGKRLLLAGLSDLRNKGVQVVVLTVDSENQAAYAIYQSAGFKLWKRSLWYEKALIQGAATN